MKKALLILTFFLRTLCSVESLQNLYTIHSCDDNSIFIQNSVNNRIQKTTFEEAAIVGIITHNDNLIEAALKKLEPESLNLNSILLIANLLTGNIRNFKIDNPHEPSYAKTYFLLSSTLASGLITSFTRTKYKLITGLGITTLFGYQTIDSFLQNKKEKKEYQLFLQKYHEFFTPLLNKLIRLKPYLYKNSNDWI